MSDDFYEEDEPVEKIERAFEDGDQGLTADDLLDRLERGEPALLARFKGNKVDPALGGLGIVLTPGGDCRIEGNVIERKTNDMNDDPTW